MDSETKSRDAKKKYRKIPVNNSFIRDKHIWDRDRELYDKIKVSNREIQDVIVIYRNCSVGRLQLTDYL